MNEPAQQMTLEHLTNVQCRQLHIARCFRNAEAIRAPSNLCLKELERFESIHALQE